MSREQKIALWVGVALIVLAGLFPPWIYLKNKHSVPQPADFGLLFWPPLESTSIDISRLLVIWATIAVVTLAAVVTLTERRVRSASG